MKAFAEESTLVPSECPSGLVGVLCGVCLRATPIRETSIRRDPRRQFTGGPGERRHMPLARRDRVNISMTVAHLYLIVIIGMPLLAILIAKLITKKSNG